MYLLKIFLLKSKKLIINDDAVPVKPTLTTLSENIVTYISGFVVKMTKRHIKCVECLEALENFSGIQENDSSLLLTLRKKRGNLIIASKDVIKLCNAVEINFRKVMSITNGKMPREDNFINQFILTISKNFYTNSNIFRSLRTDHMYNTSIFEENHLTRLIKMVVSNYTRIRVFNLCKEQTLEIKGNLIRKTLSKLILFNNQ